MNQAREKREDVHKKRGKCAFRIIVVAIAEASEGFTLKALSGNVCFNHYGLVNMGVGEGKKVSNTADVGPRWGTLGRFCVVGCFLGKILRRPSQAKQKCHHNRVYPCFCQPMMIIQFDFIIILSSLKAPKATGGYNRRKNTSTTTIQTVCFPTTGRLPTQCIKSNP